MLSASANAGSGRAGPSREQLAAALGAARELLDVLNATLDTETAGAGRLTLTCKPFDAARLARSATLLMRPKAIAKRLEMDLQVDEDLAGTGAAIGDPVRVRQILSNLLGNAVKYTSRGRVEVRIRRPTPDRIRFEVADTGPGLTPEELERAFEPFSRIERVGLGLPGAGARPFPLARPGAADGRRCLRGKRGGPCSRFWFDLPFDPEAVAAPEPPDADSADFDYAPTPVLRVLIAEDDALNAAMLRAILEQLGHQVVHAQDGRRALELVQFCEFDLIMLDGRMPHMSGQEAARETAPCPPPRAMRRSWR
ncbi:MAG: ATP-binding protein [Caulobacteraceae bacterium]